MLPGASTHLGAGALVRHAGAGRNRAGWQRPDTTPSVPPAVAPVPLASAAVLVANRCSAPAVPSSK